MRLQIFPNSQLWKISSSYIKMKILLHELVGNRHKEIETLKSMNLKKINIKAFQTKGPIFNAFSKMCYCTC